jgi:hypothetical protein
MMGKLIDFFTQKRIVVKPITNITTAFGWIVLELTPFQSFVDDWRRYGLWVALENLRYLHNS